MSVITRPGSSDERVLKEVLSGTYRKLNINFDVQDGERWLDLGANIGAFALYCAARGAAGVCYEPDEATFKILKRNVPSTFTCHNVAVGASNRSMDWFHSQKPDDHSRGTFIPSSKSVQLGKVDVKRLDLSVKYDGIKMDIEGAEGEMLDTWCIPPTDKLVLEYHSSRDTSVANFKRRLSILKRKFKVVSYPAEFDKIIESGAQKFERWVVAPALPRGGRFVQWPMADRLLFCKGAL